MSKIVSDPRLPTVNDEKIRPLTQRLYELFRQYAIAHNKSYMWDTEGTAAPTTGTWAISQKSKNTAPSGTGALVIGWICVASGTPGTWVAMTGGVGRERLTSSRTYYVRTDGSNSNDGLTDTSGGAFLTIQYAIDVVSSILDIASDVTVTIKVADGTYTGVNTCKSFVGGGKVEIVGNTTTPSSCIVSVSSGQCFGVLSATKYTINGFKVTTSGSNINSLLVTNNGILDFLNIDFGSCASMQICSMTGGSVNATGNYTISGSGQTHCYAISGGRIYTSLVTVTLTGTPNFSVAYVWMDRGLGMVDCYSMSFSGSATGKRYIVNNNSVCFTNGAATTYLPGNTSGTTANGGQYV
jgi:hypothetical protein